MKNKKINNLKTKLGIVSLCGILLVGCGSASSSGDEKSEQKEKKSKTEKNLDEEYEDVIRNEDVFTLTSQNNNGMAFASEISAYDAQYAPDYYYNEAQAECENTYSESYSNDSSYASDSYSETGDLLSESDQASQTGKRKLIRNVNMDVETLSFDETLFNLESKTKALDGYIEKMETYNGSKYSNKEVTRNSVLIVRIPQENMDSFLNEVNVQSNVVRRSESMKDVTLDYVDLESRKKSLMVEQDRVFALLEKSEEMSEIIYLENRLTELRYEIESMEAQLRSYDNKVDYGTVYLNISEVKELTLPEPEPSEKEEKKEAEAEEAEPTTWEKMKAEFTENAKELGEKVADFGIAFFAALPVIIVVASFLVVFLLVFLIVKHNIKKKKIKKAKKEEK